MSHARRVLETPARARLVALSVVALPPPDPAAHPTACSPWRLWTHPFTTVRDSMLMTVDGWIFQSHLRSVTHAEPGSAAPSAI